jgi:hypothetical protein
VGLHAALQLSHNTLAAGAGAEGFRRALLMGGSGAVVAEAGRCSSAALFLGFGPCALPLAGQAARSSGSKMELESESQARNHDWCSGRNLGSPPDSDLRAASPAPPPQLRGSSEFQVTLGLLLPP